MSLKIILLKCLPHLPRAKKFNVLRFENTGFQCQQVGKIFIGPMYKLLLSFTVISDVHMSFIPNKRVFTKYCLTQWLWNPLSKVGPGKFNRSDGHNNYNCFQDRPNFHEGLGQSKLSQFLTLGFHLYSPLGWLFTIKNSLQKMYILTYLALNKIIIISVNALNHRMEIMVLQFRFHWNLFRRVHLTMNCWFR